MADGVPETLRQLASREENLHLLLLFGSRGRGDPREDSDWDLGFLAEGGFDADSFRVELIHALATDAVDLADLSRANGLLRYRAARDGVVVFERDGAFQDFWWEAVNFWCDVEPVLRRSYQAVLGELPGR